MKPKAQVGVIQRREGREETRCFAPPHSCLARRDALSCTLTDTEVSAWNTGANRDFYR